VDIKEERKGRLTVQFHNLITFLDHFTLNLLSDYTDDKHTAADVNSVCKLRCKYDAFWGYAEVISFHRGSYGHGKPGKVLEF